MTRPARCVHFLFAFFCVATPVLAGEVTFPPGIWWPVPPSYYLPCYPFVSCADYQWWQLQERRRARERMLGEEPPTAVPQPPLRVPPPNPDTVRPEFAESGTVREQYRGSGQLLTDPPRLRRTR